MLYKKTMKTINNHHNELMKIKIMMTIIKIMVYNKTINNKIINHNHLI